VSARPYHADRRDRRRVMIAAQTGMAFVARGRRGGLAWIYLLNALSFAGVLFSGSRRLPFVTEGRVRRLWHTRDGPSLGRPA